jgi:hypothetical protein
MRFLGKSRISLLLASVLAVSAVSPGQSPPPSPPNPSLVVVISVDQRRAEYLDGEPDAPVLAPVLGRDSGKKRLMGENR